MARGLRKRLREMIDEKPNALGTFITLGDPVAVELAGLAGIRVCRHRVRARRLESRDGPEPSPRGGARSRAGYAISTPVHRQIAATGLAARAEGYGFRGFVVDGNEFLAVYATTVDAVNRALAGGGPTLIECRTYRMGFHNTSDNPKEYRDRAEVDEAEQRDPIERVRRFATREGVWSADQERPHSTRSGLQSRPRSDRSKSCQGDGAAAIFEHVYQTLPPRLQQQKAEALDDAKPS